MEKEVAVRSKDPYDRSLLRAKGEQGRREILKQLA